jgi:hypothetical protein
MKARRCVRIAQCMKRTCSLLVLWLVMPVLHAADYASHPPMRPLPAASARPFDEGPRRFVDAAKGSDEHDGSEQKPWRTFAHAVKQLAPGDALVLRGGLYREHVMLSCAGTPKKPITIRSFHDSPETAWEPFPHGAPGEFRSTKTYPKAGAFSETDDQTETTLLGNFADSMVPLQGAHVMGDLRSTNEFWTLGGKETKAGAEKFLYCGPTICYDDGSQRIHARFAPTTLQGLGEDNYRGESDPRKLRLVIATLNAGPGVPVRHPREVGVQDIVVRGARAATIEVENCDGIAFEGVTSYGGASAMKVQCTRGLRMLNCALRGIAAPWTFRSSLKYRSIEARVFNASPWEPSGQDNEDFEISHCEFTDSVDGVFVGNVAQLTFFNNLVENISDDGMFLTSGTAPDGSTHGGGLIVQQNRFARCLTTFAFGVGHGRQKALPSGRQTGKGVWIYGNVFDLRRWVPYFQPLGPDKPQEFTFAGRLCGDHGGPAWEPIDFYHNTVLAGNAPFRGGYLDGLGRAIAEGTTRRLLNNILVQCGGLPGNVFQEKNPDLIGDGNLHWCAAPGNAWSPTEFLQEMRSAKAAQEGRARYAEGWGAHDVAADPLFVKFSADWRERVDLRLREGSPARRVRVLLPVDWPPVPHGDAVLGAMQVNEYVSPTEIGVAGRLDLSGNAMAPDTKLANRSARLPDVPARPIPAASSKPVALVEGYPAFDAPLLQYALRKGGARVEHVERAWLDTQRWHEFSTVAFVGSLARARSPVSKFSVEDLPRVRAFMEEGGTLLLLRATTDMFSSDHGQKFLKEICGDTPKLPAAPSQILLPEHAWVKHLDAAVAHPWLSAKSAQPLRTTAGENILGTREGLSTLCRIPVGKGAFVYVGWEIAASLPDGRKPSTVDLERIYEEQYQILEKIVRGGR